MSESVFTPKNIMIQERSTCGKVLSTTSTSFEKRLRMRPRGVVSNRPIFQRKTFFSIDTCMSRAAYTAPIARPNDAMKKVMAMYSDDARIHRVDDRQTTTDRKGRRRRITILFDKI